MASRKIKAALTKTQRRKKEHLELCLDTESVASPTSTGLERYRFLHNALPELDIDELDLSTEFLGKRLKAPLLISSMTGGFDLARKVNRNLAAAAQQLAERMPTGPDDEESLRQTISVCAPYKGLLTFQPEDQQLYFGSPAHVTEVVDRLHQR